MQFVEADVSDKKEILALYRSLAGSELCTWTEDYPDERHIEGDFARNGLFCLKNEGGEIIGVISIDQDEAVENLPCWSKNLMPAAELARLGVRSDCQNQGVARRLLLYAMDELRRRGNMGVHFLVSKENKKAIRSYDKLCFDIVGECDLYGEAWWCYEKSLRL